MNWIIVTEPYKELSNGVKIMHKFCHTLNSLKEQAYMAFLTTHVPINGKQDIILSNDPRLINLNLNTPPLMQRDDYFINNSIFILPESLIKNPFPKSKIVRFLGNKPGFCTPGYNCEIHKNEFILSHSKIFSQNANSVLFNSFIDNFFYDQEEYIFKDRVLDLVYHGKGILTSTCDTFENTYFIDRQWPKDRKQLAYLLKQCRYFYTYDSMTNLNAEAVAAGAVPIFLRYDPWKQEEIDSMECGKFPRGELLEIKDNKVYATVNIEKFNEERKNFLNKVKYYEETWDNRFKETVEQIKQYFS